MSAEPEQAARVEVRRSARRRRTVSAYRDGDVTVVLLPARMSRAEERKWVRLMLDRLNAQETRRRTPPGDEALLQRARRLAATYFGMPVRPSSVRWVDNQKSRWGSCTPEDGTIRLSRRLQAMPSWVVDYVLVHELAHLQVAGHDADFWALVSAYPRAERARGYLEGVAATAGLQLDTDGLELRAGSEIDADGGFASGWQERAGWEDAAGSTDGVPPEGRPPG